MVDRLLAQPAFGEHWARLWLDQARYADSAGYADDPLRTIWAYRDYLIRAFNANKPFDQFTTEQLAGDLLPHPTEEQRIATAFHRNTPTNSEARSTRSFATSRWSTV
jgi:DNA-binding LytR/AlgR family response regulator